MSSSTDILSGVAPHETRDGWLVLTEPGTLERNRRVASMRHIVAQLVLAIVVVLLVVGLVGALVSRRLAEQQGVHQATQITDVLAESAVQPLVTDEIVSRPSAVGPLNDAVRGGVLGGSLVRVKIWDRSGRIVYSDEARLVGRRYALDDEARESFTQHATQADVSDLRAPENRYERDLGKLLEVYRPVWTPKGTPLLFEAYYRYDSVTARSSDLWRAFIGIMLSSLAAVFVLLIPVAWGLVQRARRAQRQREAAMRRAVEAQLEERRRIAGTLHDGVVQQLAAASFAIAGDAERAGRQQQEQLATNLHETAATVRASMAGMRSLLVDLYPPSLRSGGLVAAIRDLSGSVAGTDAQVELDLDEQLAQRLPEEVQETIYRLTQESLRNAVKHAGARHVLVRLGSTPAGLRLEVGDDGVGFDAAAALQDRPEGHLGLDLLADAARRVDGRLELRSSPGRGTTYRLEVTL